MKTSLRPIVGLFALSLSAFLPNPRGQAAPTLTTLYEFSGGSDGSDPECALVEGTDGNFYGTTAGGGINNGGTVFQITPDGVLTTLYLFTGGDDGSTPYAGLALGSDGTFYGTTSEGTSKRGGTIFNITDTGEFNTLHAFDPDNGEGSAAEVALTEVTPGEFYGTSFHGGSKFEGTVFSISSKGTFATVYTFLGSTDGAFPQAGVTLGKDGKLYGTTQAGSTDQNGTIYQLTTTGTEFTLLSLGANAAYSAKSNPAPTGLTLGTDGNFYGATAHGGSGNFGTAFRITPGGTFTLLHTFSGTGPDGHGPLSDLLLASDGNFYGVTSTKIFMMTPDGTVTPVYSFGANLQPAPSGNLIQGSDGNFYGTTENGGTAGKGTVFRLNVAPSITSATTAKATAGQAFTYQITATNSPTSFNATGLPSGLSVNKTTGKISGTPASTSVGTKTIHLTAANGLGQSTATLTLTIGRAAPVITSAATASATTGKAFSYTITASNDPTSFDATGLPSGLSVNKKTGVISGTPASTASGTKTLHLTATNSAGSGTKTLTLMISK